MHLGKEIYLKLQYKHNYILSLNFLKIYLKGIYYNNLDVLIITYKRLRLPAMHRGLSVHFNTCVTMCVCISLLYNPFDIIGVCK